MPAGKYSTIFQRAQYIFFNLLLFDRDSNIAKPGSYFTVHTAWLENHALILEKE
jgi:hypothetical protein